MAERGSQGSSSARGAGLVSSEGGAPRHILFFLIISMLIYFFDASTGFQRVGLNPFAWFSSPFFWVYLIFVVFVALVFKLSWNIDEKQIGLFVGIYFFVWIVPSLKSVAAFIPDWVFVLLGLAGPIYFMFILPHEQTRVEKWVTFVFILLLIVVFFDSIAEAAEKQLGPEGVAGIEATKVETGGVVKKVVQTFINLPTNLQKGFTNIKESVTKEWQRQIKFATGDYYTGQVDQNANEKLGVYIEDIKLSEPVVYEGEPLSIWAILKARTLGDKIVPVEVSCKTKDKEGNEIAGYTNIGTEEKSRKFEIAKMEEEDVDCNFEKHMLDTGTYDIKFNAVFNFTTMSYLKTYFINKERLRSLTQEGIDVFDHYGITDKEPIAVYTNGPVMIGMETSQPPVGLSTDYDNKPRLGITIDNQWEGKVKQIRNLIIYIPESIEIGACLDSFEPYDIIKEEEKQKGYNAYKLRDEIIKESNRFKNIENFITINCRLNIPSYKVNSLLGKTPITTKYFKVTVDYVYELEKGISVSIKEPNYFNVRIKETKPVSKDDLNCFGKHPDKKLSSAECYFYKVKGERETTIGDKDKVKAVCSEKECNCILRSEFTKRDDIIKCKMIATIKTDEEEEKETDSDSVTIRNSPPEIDGEIKIDKAIVNEDLVCEAAISDYDNDPITATYEFSGDYAETGNANCEGNKCIAKIGGFKVIEGASITCKMVPNDGIVNGKEKTKSVVVKGVET